MDPNFNLCDVFGDTFWGGGCIKEMAAPRMWVLDHLHDPEKNCCCCCCCCCGVALRSVRCSFGTVPLKKGISKSICVHPRRKRAQKFRPQYFPAMVFLTKTWGIYRVFHHENHVTTESILFHPSILTSCSRLCPIT